MKSAVLAISLALLCRLVAAADQAHLPIYKDEFDSPITTKIDAEFYNLANKAGTDKVNDHMYDFVYSRLLSHVRFEQLRVLEIGLGCNMEYGPGRSLKLWREYLPNAKLAFLEQNAECATKHKASIEAQGVKLYIGDQAHQKDLDLILADAMEFGGYDLIIDDGGHTVDQIMPCIRTLWKAVRPGGAYVVEDISENYQEKRFGSPDTFIAFAKSVIDIVQCRMKPDYMTIWKELPVLRDQKRFCANTFMDVVSIECAPEACTLIKGRSHNEATSANPLGSWPLAQPKSSRLRVSQEKHIRA